MIMLPHVPVHFIFYLWHNIGMRDRYDHLAGDKDRQEFARRRAEAIRTGTLPEFEAELKAEEESRESGVPTHIIPESISDRQERTVEGKPEAAFLQEAFQYRLRNPNDERSLEELAAALMEGEELDRAA
jgi:hypothetical protein